MTRGHRVTVDLILPDDLFQPTVYEFIKEFSTDKVFNKIKNAACEKRINKCCTEVSLKGPLLGLACNEYRKIAYVQ